MGKKRETVVIIGAGPAGLTAAYELVTNSEMKVILLESDKQVGGISKTVDYKGNKIDIGGHRFFSKSDWVLNWWQKFLPILSNADEIATTYQNQHKMIQVGRNVDESIPHMLIRPRKSRIFHNKHLFDYPLKLNIRTFKGIGLWKSLKIASSILLAKAKPIKNEKNLEDFYINRFGKELYTTFFKDYTHKVWGKPCNEISAEWGRQRVKGLNFRKIIKHYLSTLFYPQRQGFANKKTEQTLTEYFLYPQKGPGQLWEEVASKCIAKNVKIQFNQQVIELISGKNGREINEVKVKDLLSGTLSTLSCNYVISSMPVKSLAECLTSKVPEAVYKIASNLEYRDFLIVGLLLDDLAIKDKSGNPVDNWLYIQDDGVKLGRLQLFHNWSPYMVKDKSKFWIGAEYFCQEGDDLWDMDNDDLIKFASKELTSIELIDSTKVLDGTVVRMPKAYPSYIGNYQHFGKVKDFFNDIDNLYLIGRNGTHRYNNQDHSMLTALEAVNNIIQGKTDKDNIWQVNTEQEYHEEKRS